MLKKSSTRTDSFLRNNLSVEINFCVLFFFNTCNSLFKFGTVDVLTQVKVYMYLQTVWYC